MTYNRTTARLAALVLLAVLALTACGSGDDASSPATTTSTPAAGPHNDADVTFAADMVPHHALGVDMATMAADHADDARVTSLAADIEDAQSAEITQMTGWLEGWGEGTPDTSMAGMPGMPGMQHMPGMMTDAEMDDLDKAVGTDFDTLWLRLMIRHHEGALVMARAELHNGVNPAAKELAKKILASQSAQIEDMQDLLGDL